MSELQRVYGLHAVSALLARHGVAVRRLWVLDSRHDARLAALLERARTAGVRVDILSRAELERLAEGGIHQGVVAEIAVQGPRGEKELPAFLDGLSSPPFLLVLDGVQDPHNLGACLRSADAAGAHALIIPKDKAVGITPVVRKVACGAAESLPVFAVTNLARVLERLKSAGVWLYGAAGEAEQTLYAADLTGPLALLLGAEGKGLRRLTREHCDALVSIPMAGSVESLNVSAAAAVMLFEARRQRLG